MKLTKLYSIGSLVEWKNITATPVNDKVELRTEDGHYLFVCSTDEFEWMKKKPLPKGAFAWLLKEE